MTNSNPSIFSVVLLLVICGCSTPGPVEPGSRPAALIAELSESTLKERLANCSAGPFERTNFSIAHRGAPLGYPEHTAESYRAAAKMGAGIIECDVTFTSDLALVCRHSQCDLHRTTNILDTPLAATCREPFTPANAGAPAQALCCTSEISVEEFKGLCGRRDVVDVTATNVADYLQAPAAKVAVEPTECGTVLTHAESIALINQIGADFTPELKAPQVDMPFNGMSQVEYANRLLAEYDEAGIDPARVHPQSFNIDDVQHWISNHPAYADQVVYLDPRGRHRDFKASLEGMLALKQAGITTLAPPMPMLLTTDEEGNLTASPYARFARQAGLRLITWTFESGDPTDPDNWLYANLPGFVDREARMLEVLHALAEEAEIEGIFSDWPGTVTFYANCFGRT